MHLQASLGRTREPIEDYGLKLLHDAQDYPGMLRLIRASMGLSTRITLGLVNSGGPENSPAWLQSTTYPALLQMIGFETKRTLFLRKSFLSLKEFESLVLAMAHEMGHILLDERNHPLKHEEVAVDLTAMMLGYRDFYVTGCQTSRYSTLGYLNPAEVRYAAYYMTFGSPPPGY